MYSLTYPIIAGCYILVCFVSVVAFLKACYIVGRFALKLVGTATQAFGTDTQQRLISLGLAVVFFWSVPGRIVQSVIQAFIQLITSVPDAMYSAWREAEFPLRNNQWEGVLVPLAVAIAEAWTKGLRAASQPLHSRFTLYRCGN